MTNRRFSTLAAALLLTTGSAAMGATSAAAATTSKPYYTHAHCTGYVKVGKTSVQQSTCVTSSISLKTVAAGEWVRIKNTGKTNVTVTEKCTVELWNAPSYHKHRTIKKWSKGSSTGTAVEAGQAISVQPTLCQGSVGVPKLKGNASVDYHATGSNTVQVTVSGGARTSKATSATEELGALFAGSYLTGASGTDGCPSGYSPTFHNGKDNRECIGIVG